MSEAGRSTAAALRARSYGTAAVVFALDRLTKWMVESNLSAFDTVRVIPGLFNIVRSENRGMAFGIMNDASLEWRTTLLIVAAAAAVVFMAIMLWKPQRLDRNSYWGLTLILGGAAGNVFDRIAAGKVTDFLDFYIADHHWHTFNLADSAIVVGSGLLLLDMIRPKKQAANVS
ncbi:MAG: signal peptidase II [Candidatus Solibacter sp.]